MAGGVRRHIGKQHVGGPASRDLIGARAHREHRDVRIRARYWAIAAMPRIASTRPLLSAIPAMKSASLHIALVLLHCGKAAVVCREPTFAVQQICAALRSHFDLNLLSTLP